MILLTHQTRILLSIAPSDFRRGIDGHAAICQNELLLNPRDQSVYVFINKAKTMIRALSYDGSGYWLMTKRISRGKFQGWPTSAGGAVSETTALQLRCILGGSSWEQANADSSVLASAARSTTLETQHTVARTP